MKILECLCENHGDHANHRIPLENHKQKNENLRIPQNNFKNNESHIIPYENQENQKKN